MQNDAAKGALAGASSLLALAATTQAGAQESTPPASGGKLEEVVVTGLRISLQRNLDIKRDAVGVVRRSSPATPPRRFRSGSGGDG